MPQSPLSESTLALLRDLRLAESFATNLPEVVLTATILLVVIYDMFFKREESHKSGVLALAGTGFALLTALADTTIDAGLAFHGSFVADGMTRFLRVILLFASAFVILQSLLSKTIDQYRQGEYYAIVLSATLSMIFLAGAGNIIVFFLALETLSFCSYILSGYVKGTRVAAEASIKYLMYGTMASGVLLFGLSYLYGLGGSIDIDVMMKNAYAGPYTLLATLGLIMALVGLFFKTSIAPFHVWTPDIYQGSPTPVTALLAVASKAAGFAAMIRLLTPVWGVPALSEFAQIGPGAVHIDLRFFFGIVAILSMTIGNFAALRQRDFKRLLAYSSISHAGYLALGFCNLTDATRAALLGYFAVYLFMNMAFFISVTLLENEGGTSDMYAYAGAGRRHPLLASCMVIALVSLIGLPPTAGFTAKWQLFSAVVYDDKGGLLAWNVLLVLIALLNSVVSLAYYIRPAKILLIDDPKAGTEAIQPAATPLMGMTQPAFAALVTLVLLTVTVPILGMFLDWGSVMQAARAL